MGTHYNQFYEYVTSIETLFKALCSNSLVAAYGCNLDHNGVLLYIHAKPDLESQQRLLNFVDGIQTAIQRAGINVSSANKCIN